MPDKPHPWGDKLFLMYDDSRFCYPFEIYSGDDERREPTFAMQITADIY